VRVYNGIVVICWAVVAAGCVSGAPTSGVDKVLAPGADKVKITRNPADVGGDGIPKSDRWARRECSVNYPGCAGRTRRRHRLSLSIAE
jgi:hypothetical protein